MKTSQKLSNNSFQIGYNFFVMARKFRKRLLWFVHSDQHLVIQHEQATSSFLMGGNVNQNTTNLFRNAGDNGRYWSSTPESGGSNAYNLNFNGTSNINPSNNNNRQNGNSVRCPLLCPISKL